MAARSIRGQINRWTWGVVQEWTTGQVRLLSAEHYDRRPKRLVTHWCIPFLATVLSCRWPTAKWPPSSTPSPCVSFVWQQDRNRETEYLTKKRQLFHRQFSSIFHHALRSRFFPLPLAARGEFFYSLTLCKWKFPAFTAKDTQFEQLHACNLNRSITRTEFNFLIDTRLLVPSVIGGQRRDPF